MGYELANAIEINKVLQNRGFHKLTMKLRDTIDLAATYTIGLVVKAMARRNGTLPMQARFAMRTC